MVSPTAENIARAADAVRAGRLVGMPTETVYGIAANALDPVAVRATFAAKGRPAENPLIVHVADIAGAESVAAAFPPIAAALADRFWPGPLTLVLPKRAHVPPETTGGLDTVAIRLPAHEVALALIRAVGIPLSAPSANRFMGLSPTRADDIDPEVAASMEFILDGGPCRVGLESTVLDLSGDIPRLLRPGGITAEALAEVLGDLPAGAISGERRSPGMYPRHYAPRTPVILVEKLGQDQWGIQLGPGSTDPPSKIIVLPDDPAAYASGLYAALHQLDRLGLAAIYVEAPPDTPEWSAVRDRLRRAAS